MEPGAGLWAGPDSNVLITSLRPYKMRDSVMLENSVVEKKMQGGILASSRERITISVLDECLTAL
jgi:hypothetical protein